MEIPFVLQEIEFGEATPASDRERPGMPLWHPDAKHL
jgi:hypothetical protein